MMEVRCSLAQAYPVVNRAPTMDISGHPLLSIAHRSERRLTSVGKEGIMCPLAQFPLSRPVARRSRKLLLVLVFICLAAGFAYGSVRLLVPEEDPGGPYYARIEFGLVHHTEEWAAIAFYRDPSCVPATFNLLRFFDPNVPRVFGCTLTVEGFDVWKNGPPPVDMAPIQSKLTGLGAVPVWFVSWPELQGALADNILTKQELLALSSLQMGTATFFKEVLHPLGGAQQSALALVARGTLADGRTFSYHAVEAAGELRLVQIDIR